MYEFDEDCEEYETIIKEAGERKDLPVHIDFYDGNNSWAKLEVLSSQIVVAALVASEASCVVPGTRSRWRRRLWAGRRAQ